MSPRCASRSRVGPPARVERAPARFKDGRGTSGRRERRQRAALAAADLVEVLEGPGPFTVLAPTDEAFAKLPAGTVESLLKPENKDKLRTILLYHVIPGRVYSDTVVTLKYKVADAQGKLIEASPEPMAYLHGGYENTLPKIEEALDGQEGDRGVSWLPFFHDMGLITVLLSPMLGHYITFMTPAAWRRPGASPITCSTMKTVSARR